MDEEKRGKGRRGEKGGRGAEGGKQCVKKEKGFVEVSKGWFEGKYVGGYSFSLSSKLQAPHHNHNHPTPTRLA